MTFLGLFLRGLVVVCCAVLEVGVSSKWSHSTVKLSDASSRDAERERSASSAKNVTGSGFSSRLCRKEVVKSSSRWFRCCGWVLCTGTRVLFWCHFDAHMRLHVRRLLMCAGMYTARGRRFEIFFDHTLFAKVKKCTFFHRHKVLKNIRKSK